MSKNVTSKRHEVEWADFGVQYLTLAQQGLIYLVEQDEKASDWKYKAPLIIPILWNTKHSLELFLKSLRIAAEKRYSEGHNLSELNLELEAALKNKKINSSSISEFTKLVDKYFANKFWKGKISSHLSLFDVQNDCFRYPDSKSEVSIDWDTLLRDGITKEDLIEVQKDLAKIFELGIDIFGELIFHKG